MINILSIPAWAALFSMGTEDAAGFSWKQTESVKIMFSQSQYCDLISHSWKNRENCTSGQSRHKKMYTQWIAKAFTPLDYFLHKRVQVNYLHFCKDFE